MRNLLLLAFVLVTQPLFAGKEYFGSFSPGQCAAALTAKLYHLPFQKGRGQSKFVVEQMARREIAVRHASLLAKQREALFDLEQEFARSPEGRAFEDLDEVIDYNIEPTAEMDAAFDLFLQARVPDAKKPGGKKPFSTLRYYFRRDRPFTIRNYQAVLNVLGEAVRVFEYEALYESAQLKWLLNGREDEADDRIVAASNAALWELTLPRNRRTWGQRVNAFTKKMKDFEIGKDVKPQTSLPFHLHNPNHVGEKRRDLVLGLAGALDTYEAVPNRLYSMFMPRDLLTLLGLRGSFDADLVPQPIGLVHLLKVHNEFLHRTGLLPTEIFEGMLHRMVIVALTP